MNIMIDNGKVACTPYPTIGVTTTVRAGLPVLKQKHDLTKLTVVYDCRDGEYRAGEEVWVRGETCAHAWSKEVFELEKGKPFVLVPISFVVCMRDARPL